MSTTTSTTHFAIPMYKLLIQRDSKTLATKHKTITTTFKYMLSNNSHIALYTQSSNPYSTPGANNSMIGSVGTWCVNTDTHTQTQTHTHTDTHTHTYTHTHTHRASQMKQFTEKGGGSTDLASRSRI